jgi:transcriptional regulator with XRE-family HTH domain
VTLKALKCKEPKSLGERIRRRRLALGLTQRQAADRLGVDVFTLLGWEKGKWQPAERNLQRIAEYLKRGVAERAY